MQAPGVQMSPHQLWLSMEAGDSAVSSQLIYPEMPMQSHLPEPYGSASEPRSRPDWHWSAVGSMDHANSQQSLFLDQGVFHELDRLPSDNTPGGMQPPQLNKGSMESALLGRTSQSLFHCPPLTLPPNTYLTPSPFVLPCSCPILQRNLAV